MLLLEKLEKHHGEAVNTTARELVACHQVVHDPQSSWMHKLGEMAGDLADVTCFSSGSHCVEPT